MALNFPATPTLNQTYSFGAYTWQWDGNSWVGAVPIVNATINNTTIGAVTPSTGAFTTLAASSTVSGTGFSTYLASPPAIGSSAANTGAFTTLSASGAISSSGSQANNFGAGGTGTGVSLFVLNGGSGTNGGSEIAFFKNSIQKAVVGIDSCIAGGTSDNLMNYVASGGTIRNYIGGTGDIGTFTSTGLGIGTASPAYKLQVAGTVGEVAEFTSSAVATAVRINNTNAAGWGSSISFNTNGTAAGFLGSIGSLIGSTAQDLAIYATAGNGFRVYTNGNNERLRVDASGNLGLGVTPSAWSQGNAFEMYAAGYGIWNGSGAPSSMYMLANAYFNGGFKYGGTGQASHYYQYQGAHVWSTAPTGTAGNAISFTQAMTLDASGNLGIGATGNLSKLTVGAGNNLSTYALAAFNTANANIAGLIISNWTGSATTQGPRLGFDNSGLGTFYIGGSNGSNNFDICRTWGTPDVRIDGSGNVGIGTTSPYGKLSVANGSNENIEFTAGLTSLNGGALQYINRTTGTTRPDFNYYLASGGGSHKFYTNDSERMRIDSSGNLGLGVTPSAWVTFKAFDIGTQGAIASIGTQMAMFQNAYWNGSAYTYKTSNLAALYDQVNGQHQWFIAPSGTAGNAISFTQAMTLDAGGNLLVNSTTNDQWYTSTNAGFTLNSSNFLAIARSGGSVFIANRLTSDGDIIEFKRSGSLVGSISVTTLLTSYNTTSDYRRKFNVKDLTGSGTFIDALKPRTFDWDTGDKGVGFIAHEFAEVSPSSVNGQKDAVDEEGKPKYQSMQASSAEVIANLVAELQSLRQRVAALESK